MDTRTFQIRRGGDRGRTELGWLHARHSFSFGGYFDPANTRFGTLRVLNDDVIDPGGGFGEHGHDNMEIITWVLAGALEHGDNLGHRQLLRPGEVQVMSAGTGIRHSEHNASQTEPVHLLQIWILPAQRDTEPRYEQKTFDAADRLNRWDTLVSGRGGSGPLLIGQDAEMKVADLQPGRELTLEVPAGRSAYVHLARGDVEAADEKLTAGDAITLKDPEALTLKGLSEAQLLWFDLG
ncbi:MAG: pirin family protein [Phycisphaeraceae bacterium]|nr:pirin family protein [Phycisphaeraceae bacterium]